MVKLRWMMKNFQTLQTLQTLQIQNITMIIVGNSCQIWYINCFMSYLSSFWFFPFTPPVNAFNEVPPISLHLSSFAATTIHNYQLQENFHLKLLLMQTFLQHFLIHQMQWFVILKMKIILIEMSHLKSLMCFMKLLWQLVIIHLRSIPEESEWTKMPLCFCFLWKWLQCWYLSNDQLHA